MAGDIAKLTIQVEPKGIAQTNTELGKLEKNTEKAKRATDSFTEAAGKNTKVTEKQAKEIESLTDSQATFYKDLDRLAKLYGNSMEHQNALLDAQAKKFKTAKVPQQYIDQWRKLKELEDSTGFLDGIERAYRTFAGQTADAAKLTDTSFTKFFKNSEENFMAMWRSVAQTGTLTASTFADTLKAAKGYFTNFLGELAHIALTRPIMVSVTGVVNSLPWGSNGGANVSGQLIGGSGSSGAGLLRGLAGAGGIPGGVRSALKSPSYGRTCTTPLAP